MSRDTLEVATESLRVIAKQESDFMQKHKIDDINISIAYFTTVISTLMNFFILMFKVKAHENPEKIENILMQNLVYAATRMNESDTKEKIAYFREQIDSSLKGCH